MARYLNKGKPPGAYVQGHPFFAQGEIAEFPPEVEPSRHWVPLDEEAVECMKKLKVRLEEQAKAKPSTPTPRPAYEDVVTEIPSDEPDRSLVEPQDDGRTLADLGGKNNPRIDRGPVDSGDDPANRRAEGDAFATGGRKLTETEGGGKSKGARAADKVI